MLRPAFRFAVRAVNVASFLGALLLASLASGAAPCEPDILVGEDDDNYICRSRGAYRGSVGEKAATRFCGAKRSLSADQDAIGHLGFSNDIEQFNMFDAISREQKAELQHKVFDALLDQSLEGTEMALNSAKSLNPWNVNNAIRMLKDRGFQNDTVFTALRRIAATKDKPAMAAAYRDFAVVAKAQKEALNTNAAIMNDSSNATLRLLVGALKIMQGNPELGLWVTGAEIGESLAYLFYVNGQVTELSQSTDAKLLRLGTLTARMKASVEAVRSARREWRQALGIGKGEPICPS